MKSFPPDVAALFFMLVNDIVTDTCVEHRVIDWRKTFLESPLKAQTAANDPTVLLKSRHLIKTVYWIILTPSEYQSVLCNARRQFSRDGCLTRFVHCARARRSARTQPHPPTCRTHPVHCNARYVVLSFFATFLSFSRRPLLLLPPAPPPVPASSRARCPSPFVTADPTGTACCVNALAPARWPFALLRVAIFRFSSFPHDASRMAPLDVPMRWQVPGAKRTAASVAALVSCSCTIPIGDL